MNSTESPSPSRTKFSGHLVTANNMCNFSAQSENMFKAHYPMWLSRIVIIRFGWYTELMTCCIALRYHSSLCLPLEFHLMLMQSVSLPYNTSSGCHISLEAFGIGCWVIWILVSFASWYPWWRYFWGCQWIRMNTARGSIRGWFHRPTFKTGIFVPLSKICLVTNMVNPKTWASLRFVK